MENRWTSQIPSATQDAHASGEDFPGILLASPSHDSGVTPFSGAWARAGSVSLRALDQELGPSGRDQKSRPSSFAAPGYRGVLE